MVPPSDRLAPTAATRLIHGLAGAAVGFCLAWVTHWLWGHFSPLIGIAIICLCALLAALRGDAFFERIAGSRLWGFVRGYFQLPLR